MDILIGKNIKHLRTDKGITQEQLSEAMSVSCAAVSKWERAIPIPTSPCSSPWPIISA